MRPRHCLPFRTGACKSARPPRSPCNGWATAAERPALDVFYVRLAAGDERARAALTLGTAWLHILAREQEWAYRAQGRPGGLGRPRGLHHHVEPWYVPGPCGSLFMNSRVGTCGLTELLVHVLGRGSRTSG